jgi:hypothetical protein
MGCRWTREGQMLNVYQGKCNFLEAGQSQKAEKMDKRWKKDRKNSVLVRIKVVSLVLAVVKYRYWSGDAHPQKIPESRY